MMLNFDDLLELAKCSSFNTKKDEILRKKTIKNIYNKNNNKEIRKALSGKENFPDMTNVATH